MNNEEIINLGYYKNRQIYNNEFNVDILPSIKNFDFYTFIDYAEKHKKDISDYGAFLVITPKQYIIGYNSSFGTGTHLTSFANVIKEIYSLKTINSYEEVKLYSNYCKEKFITASIIYECTEEYGIPKCSGYISFDINNKKITPSLFDTFKEFYNDYNDEIKRIIVKYGLNKFQVILNIKNQDKINRIISNSLDEIYTNLKNNIDNTLIDENYEEKIIGKKIKINELILT